MTALNCYKLRLSAGSDFFADLDNFIDWDGHDIQVYGPHTFPGFTAKLYVAKTPPQEPGWAGFLRSGFGAELPIPRSAGTGALLIVKPAAGDGCFALAFGTGGRHLLLNGAWERGFGLRVALNLLYPQAQEEGAPARLVAVDTKQRRGAETLRSRRQARRHTSFEVFEVDRLRDVISAATGRPADIVTWGARISGGDAFRFTTDLAFGELGELCHKLDAAYARTDYLERFPWLENFRPVSDPELLQKLEAEVLAGLRSQVTSLELAPPEVIDWDRVAGFRFHFERQPGRARSGPVIRPELRLVDYLRGLEWRGKLERVDAAYLRRHCLFAVDEDGDTVYRWPVWRCLGGEFELDGDTYALDDGEFFVIEREFLRQLDQQLGALLRKASLPLPPARRGTKEHDYTAQAVAAARHAFVLLDKRTVTIRHHTTPVEICDIFTRDRQLVHVKRYLASRELSHLFAQGYVSATLIQQYEEFRSAAQEKINEAAGNSGVCLTGPHGFTASDFEVTYAIIADWGKRTFTEALPFFSKVNLLRVAEDLTRRGFKVSYCQVPLAPR